MIQKPGSPLGTGKTGLEMEKNMNQEKQKLQEKVELTVDEIQAIMDNMDKKTFGATTSMEWEGSIQNAPKEFDKE